MLTVSEQGERWEDGEVSGSVELTPDTRVRLVRKHCLRIVNEQDANLDQVPQEGTVVRTKGPNSNTATLYTTIPCKNTYIQF